MRRERRGYDGDAYYISQWDPANRRHDVVVGGGIKRCIILFVAGRLKIELSSMRYTSRTTSIYELYTVCIMDEMNRLTTCRGP
jgi:hypothetical protein